MRRLRRAAALLRKRRQTSYLLTFGEGLLRQGQKLTSYLLTFGEGLLRQGQKQHNSDI